MATEDENYYYVKGVKIFKLPTSSGVINYKEIRNKLDSEFNKVVSNFLSKITNNENLILSCSEELRTPYVIFVNENNELAEEFSSIKEIFLTNPNLDRKSFEEFLQSNNIKIGEESNTELGKALLNQFNLNNLNLLKQEFDKCTYFQYFIPLVTFNMYSNTSHQNLLIFNKNEHVITWIEPQFSGDKLNNNRIILIKNTINSIKNFLITDKIERNKYQIDIPSKPCPQSITLDKNCMFWTLLLTIILIENPNATIDEVSEAVLTKYPTANELAVFMRNFKSLLSSIMIGGKKQKKTKRRNLKKRKHTTKLSRFH